jgi:hypothetical protein
MDPYAVLEIVQTNCPKTIEDIKRSHHVRTYDGMELMVSDVAENGKPYCFGYEMILHDKHIRSEYDILVGFIALTECSFDTSFGGYSFGKRTMQMGDFQFAFLNKSVPIICSSNSEFLVTNVTGTFYVVFANLEQQMRKSVYTAEEIVYNDRIKLRYGQVEKIN